jgi:hypothetical protein
VKAIPVLVLMLVTFAFGSAGCKQASKKRWISEMSEKLPGELCKEGTYFRECFRVDRAECEKVAQRTTDKCLEQYRSQIPRILKQPRDGRHWGGKVGACAGTAYEKQLLHKRHITPKCAQVIEQLKRKAGQ